VRKFLGNVGGKEFCVCVGGKPVFVEKSKREFLEEESGLIPDSMKREESRKGRTSVKIFSQGELLYME